MIKYEPVQNKNARSRDYRDKNETKHLRIKKLQRIRKK